jgi:hypothetical protein
MGVGSDRTKVGELGFQVFGRTLHPEWFGARVFRRFAQGAWEADIRIIDGGHVILWGCGSSRLAEVLSGPEIALPESGLMFRSTLRAERSTSLRRGDTAYQTCFAAERLSPEVFAHLSHELTLLPGRSGILIHQHARANRFAPAPLSRLEVETYARGLSVHAYHTFPDDRAIVRTQSLFEIQPTA